MENYFKFMKEVETYLQFKTAELFDIARKSVEITYIKPSGDISVDSIPEDKKPECENIENGRIGIWLDEEGEDPAYEYGCRIAGGEEIKMLWAPFHYEDNDKGINWNIFPDDTGFVMRLDNYWTRNDLPF